MLWRKRKAPREAQLDGLVRIFESEKGELNEEHVPWHVRSTLLVLAGMLVLLFLGSTLFQIDRVVTSSFGQLVTVDPTVVLEPLDVSIVKSLKVQEGDHVKKGQLLAELDPTFAAADVNSLQLQMSSLDAEIARCEAELAGKPYDYVPNDNPSSALYMSLQASLYLQRKTQHDSAVHSFDEQIGQASSMILKLKNDEKRYGDREKLARELEGMRSQLIAKEEDSKIKIGRAHV